MNGTRGTRGRIVLLAALLVAASIVAMPATASAKKALTTITVPYEVAADASVPGTTPVAPQVTARLYRYKGTKRYALTGWVYCYSMDEESGALSFVAKAHASKHAFALPHRGMYVFKYFGTTKYRSATAMSWRVDSVGATVGTPTVSVAPVDGAYSQVTIAYDLGWNTEAYAGPMFFTYGGFFVTDPDSPATAGAIRGTAQFTRDVDGPETVQFSYRVKTALAFGNLYTRAGIGSGDSFVSAGADYLTYIQPL